MQKAAANDGSWLNTIGLPRCPTGPGLVNTTALQCGKKFEGSLVIETFLNPDDSGGLNGWQIVLLHFERRITSSQGLINLPPLP
jgi:hypothetical protein